MSLNKNFTENYLATEKLSLILGVTAVFVAFFGIYTPLKIAIFFVSCPLFYSYMTLGNRSGNISSAFFSLILFFAVPFKTFFDVFLNIIAPAVLIGYSSNRYIIQNRKKWWYPESFLLRDLILLSLFSVIFLSLTFYRHDIILKPYAEALKNFQGLDLNKPMYLSPFIKYAVGIGIAVKIFGSIASFRIAQIISVKRKKNLRPKFNFLDLSIPNWLAVLPLLSLALVITLDNILTFDDNLSLLHVLGGVFVISSLAPMICGFSLMHKLSEESKREWVLIFLYFLLVFATPFVILSMFFLGIVDSFYDFRTRFAKAEK